MVVVLHACSMRRSANEPHLLDSLPLSASDAAGRTPRAWFRYLRKTSVLFRVVPRLPPPPCGRALMVVAVTYAQPGCTAGVLPGRRPC